MYVVFNSEAIYGLGETQGAARWDAQNYIGEEAADRLDGARATKALAHKVANDGGDIAFGIIDDVACTYAAYERIQAARYARKWGKRPR